MVREKAQSKYVTVRVLRTTNDEIREAKIDSRFILRTSDILETAVKLYRKKQKKKKNFK